MDSAFEKISGKPSCTCKDWIRFNIPCTFFANCEHRAKWCWDSLPDVYLQSPHLNCDRQTLDSFYENNPDHDMPAEKERMHSHCHRVTTW